MFGAALPVQAHRSASPLKLKNRVETLETKIASQGAWLSSLDSENYWQDSDINTLESKTKNLNYNDDIDASHVRRPLFCYSGDYAVYGSFTLNC
jgi:hypothetical protein